MNQQLEDLMYQAGLAADGSWNQMDQYDRDAIIRLSHMIVERCSKLIIEQGTDRIDWAPSQLGIRPEYVAMAKHIKEHFGVSE
jgi:hypothetical protein